MSVINVTKMWSKSGGSLSSAKLSAIAQVWAITEGYQVLAEIGDSVDVIVAAAGIPRNGDQHTTGVNAFVESVSPSQISPIFWQVIISYRGIVNDSSVDVEWTDSTTTEPIDRDFDGRAIVTVNGEPVDGLSMDVNDQVCVIRRMFLSIDTAAIAAYRMATNSDTYLGWAPGTARLVGFSAKNKFTFGGAQEGWDVSARIQFRQPLAGATAAQAWYKRWRHEGLYVKVGDVVRRATDEQGHDSAKPVLLKSDGTQETNPEAAVFQYTQVYDSLPYSALGLI